MTKSNAQAQATQAVWGSHSGLPSDLAFDRRSRAPVQSPQDKRILTCLVRVPPHLHPWSRTALSPPSVANRWQALPVSVLPPDTLTSCNISGQARCIIFTEATLPIRLFSKDDIEPPLLQSTWKYRTKARALEACSPLCDKGTQRTL